MNELTYSFIGSLRAWLRENESVLQLHGIKVEMPTYTLHYGTTARFMSQYFESGFSVWEKRHWHLAMSDVEFADWRIADRDPAYRIEWVHYEYATIDEMRGVLDALRDRLLSVQRDNT